MNIYKDIMLNTTFWGAYTPRSGTLDSNIVTAVYSTGLYRTESEINKRNNFHETNIGLNLELKAGKVIIGSDGYFIGYDKELITSSKSVFLGKQGILTSIYSVINFENYLLAGESNRDANGNMAFKANLNIIQIDYNFAFNFRSYSPDFCSPYGSIFGENSYPNNEIGFYTGIELKNLNPFRISSYIDIFSSYERTYYVPKPVKGIDFLTQIEYKFSEYTFFKYKIQIRNKTDAVTIDTKTKEKAIYQRTELNNRLEYTQFLIKTLSVKTRLDFCYVAYESVKPNETGLAGYFELNWKIINLLNFGGRISAFSTKSYDSGIWQFESSFPGYMTTPALFGDGYRTYIYLHFEPKRNISLWVKYSLLHKNNVSTIGSSYNEIFDNNDKRFYMLVDII